MEGLGNTVLLLGLLALLFHLAKALGTAAPSWNLAQAEVTRLRGVLGPACRPAPGEKGEKEEPPDAKDADGVEELLQEAERALRVCKYPLVTLLFLFPYFLFWNGQREMAAWRLIHGAERRAVRCLCDLQVQARLKRGLGELEEFPKGKAGNWRRHLESALKEPGEGGAKGRKALLQDFLADLYDARDSRYAQLLTLHNKATYLFWLGLVLALGILYLWPMDEDQGGGSSVQPLFLFLTGLGGGLLSRLIRVVVTDRLPTDYGAYWVPLFLSPLLGGLIALLGVLVVKLGVTLRVLGDGVADLLQAPSVYGLGVLLGFSERLFQGFSQRLEEALVPQAKDRGIDAEGPPGEPAPPEGPLRNEAGDQGEGAGSKEGKPPSGASGQEAKGEKGDTAGPSPGPKGEFPRK
ncbi:hypothetical protein [Thermus caldifontis]|uniref:hypothetical protein n=1 Tax=Thermus caldifontis TaxID=1930763 RepID=UPI000DF3D193|nr:hypothetical protein [Thermus caldifontis]